MYKIFFKRVFDFTVAFILLLVFLPILLLLTIVLYFVNGQNPFFIQERPGKNNSAIRVVKFKSMSEKKDSNNQLLPDKERITPVGAFIRKTSLDELPQLFNVLNGEMSLVGPRPLLFKYISLYSEEQMRRNEVKPGITGWAQVNGRNSISWTEKFKYDVYYIENLSLWLDLKIVLLTIKKVIVREGVNQTDERPMMPFDGTN